MPETMGEKSVQFGYKAFHLLSGVATVYKKGFNFSVTPKHNSDWLVDLGMINETKDSDYPTVTFPRNSMIFYYNEENLQQIIKESFFGAEIIIGLQNQVTNMAEVADYLLKYHPGDITFRALLDDSFFDEEGLFYARKEFDYSIIDGIFERKRLDLQNSSLSS